MLFLDHEYRPELGRFVAIGQTTLVPMPELSIEQAEETLPS